MNTLLQDLRFAMRLFLKQPVFTLSVVLTLALGIGANTAIFSLIHSVLLRPLPYPESERLVRVWTYAPQQGKEMEQAPLSWPRFEAVRDSAQDVFEELGADTGGGFTLTGRGDPESVRASYASALFFQTLGIQPLRGRTFLPEEDLPGGPNVVLVTYAFWQKHAAGDPALLGQTLTLNGAPYNVVGILPPQLVFPYDRAELYVPRVHEAPGLTPAQLRQGTGFLNFTARLKPGVTLTRANEALGVIAARYRQAYPDHVDASFGIKAIPFQEEIVGEARPAFYALAGAAGCVLLIACVNVANLLLARLARRHKEIAIRSALGASGARLAQQFLTESVLLTTLAGGLGVLLAEWCVSSVHGLGPEFIPRAAEVHINLPTLGFTLAVSLLTGLLLGVVPALHAARGNVGEALQDASRGAVGGGVRQSRGRGALLIGQVAVSLVLLVGAGLLLTSLWRLQQVRLGFNPEGVLAAGVFVPPSRYTTPEKQADFFARLTERLATTPGVRRSAATGSLPLLGNGGTMFYAVIGRPIPPVKERAAARYGAVSPGYFAALEIPLKSGRAFTERDRADSPPVMVINETMARRLFPNGDAIGQRILCSVSQPTETEVVGVIGDVRSVNPAQPVAEEMFFSMFQRGTAYMSVVLRAENPRQAPSLAPTLRAVVRALDSDQPVARIQTMDALVSDSVADRRLTALLLAGFAALALVLAGVGIYGVTAYGVAQRTREIGIRLALGAQRGDVFRLIVGGGMRLIFVGIVLGLLVAFGLTRLLSGLLFGVGASDPATLGVVVLLLIGVALLANYLPARRAMRVDPLDALRET